MTALVWFRHDLRVTDNPALHQACREHEQVHAVFIDCAQQELEHNRSPIQYDFISRNLAALADTLAALGINLQLLQANEYREVPQLLRAHGHELDIDAVYLNRELGINEQRRDQACQQALQLPFHLSNGDCVIDHGSLRTGSNTYYKVFTPYSRAWLKRLQQQGYQVLPCPSAVGPSLRSPELGLPDADGSSHDWPAGEQAALQRLQDFCDQTVHDYAELRDFPARPATSSLSPYLALGILSPRQCLAELEAHCDGLPFERHQPGFIWLSELIWREFYRHLMIDCPSLSMHRAFKAETEQIQWRNQPGLFQAWCQGQTGFPIVDAAMRCLLETGWMHNRLRMITAGFLCKDLLQDWRDGEAWFMSHLIDGELAANNGGWQWAAGTGADAAPYFRVFNPTTQGQRFDPQGEFTRQWLPELRDVPDKQIHSPHTWLQQHRPDSDYPEPIVDHAVARKQAIAVFDALKQAR